MVNKTSMMLFVFITVVAVGGLLWTVSDTLTGKYYAGGGGRYYYGPQRIQLSPQNACDYAGCSLTSPINIYTNEFGVKNVVCECEYGFIGVPLIQTAWVG